MKLNCDLGESYGSWKMGMDDAVMPFIDQANIACGFHAGDPVVLAKTLTLAKQHKVEIGAHPAYPDINGFGRRTMNLSDNELRQALHYQISAIWGMANVQGLTISYVKPHGALYNDMMKNDALRQTIMTAIADFPVELSLMLQATPKHAEHTQEAENLGIRVIFEAFADRCYTDSGLLVARSKAHAVHNKDAMLSQVKQLVTNGSVVSENGKAISFPVDSICVHGDNETGVQNIAEIKRYVNEQ